MIRPRSAWGAAPSRGAGYLPDTVGLAVHWEGPHMGAYAETAVPGLIRGIQRYHMDTQGWADIAYNYVVDRYGGAWEGRGWNARSAANGTGTSNSNYLAVCYLGGQGDEFTAAAKAAIQGIVAEHVTRGGRPEVTGHRDHVATACPGDDIYAWVKADGPFGAPSAPADQPPEWSTAINENRIDLCGAGPDGRVMHQYADARRNEGRWSKWSPIGGLLTDETPSIVWHRDWLHFFAVERGTGRVMQCSWHEGTEAWAFAGAWYPVTGAGPVATGVSSAVGL